MGNLEYKMKEEQNQPTSIKVPFLWMLLFSYSYNDAMQCNTAAGAGSMFSYSCLEFDFLLHTPLAYNFRI